MEKLIILTLSWLFIGIACTENSREKQANLASLKAQTNAISPADYHDQNRSGKLFVIEHEMPGAGNLTGDELRNASEQSNKVLSDLGPDIQWIHSYVSENKVYCVHRAPSEELIKQHAQQTGFPANTISEASTIISPATSD